MAISNITPTWQTNYWGDGQSFKSQYGDSGEPVINTQTIGYWGDGQAWLYPFQNTQSGGAVHQPTYFILINMAGLN